MRNEEYRIWAAGIVLFLFIPLVLFLYLRQPLGPALSVGLGLVIMFGHRFVAAPWMLHHATERCLWCGRAVTGNLSGRPAELRSQGRADSPRATRATTGHGQPAFELFVRSGDRDRQLAACSLAHRDQAARFLTFAWRYRALVAVGIFVPLVILLVASLALAAGHPLLPQEWNTWQFKTIVAFTVVLASLAYRGVPRPAEVLRSPFPLHNLFLLGIRNTLWVFRLVGAWWLIAGFLQVSR